MQYYFTVMMLQFDKRTGQVLCIWNILLKLMCVKHNAKGSETKQEINRKTLKPNLSFLQAYKRGTLKSFLIKKKDNENTKP